MSSNGPQPYPPYPSPPFPGARPPRPPHVSQQFSWGGWVLTIIVTVYLLSLWFAFLGVALAIIVVCYGAWALLVMEPRGTMSFGGRLPWSTLSGASKFCLVCAFLLLPEFMLPICLWFAVRDHLRATNTSLIGQARGYWQRAVAASRRTQIGLAAAALVTLIAFCSLSGVASAHSVWATDSGSATALVDGSDQSAQNNSQITQITAPTATAAPTMTPLPTDTPVPQPTDTPLPRPTATPVPPAPANLFLAITCASAVDYSYGQVCVHTEPGAALQITVTYCSGYSATSKSLQGVEYANSSGNYTWSWTPETKCRGQADAYVTADWNGREVTNDKTFNVQ